MGKLDAMSTAPDRLLGPNVDPLILLLHFVAMFPGRDVFAPVADPAQLFEALQRELPGVTPEDLLFGAAIANQLGRQLRGVNWRLRGGTEKPQSAEPRPRGVGAVRRFKPGDERLLALPEVIDCWRVHIGLKAALKVKDVIKRSKDFPEFEEVLLAVASDGHGHSVSAHRLGLWLSRVESLAIDGVALRFIEYKFGYPRWALLPASR